MAMAMAKFERKTMKQAYFKIGIYGATGSGKTFTSLLCAEKLAEAQGKRVAMIDTERGSDWYSVSIAEREVHPEAFDFDCLETRSLATATDAVANFDLKTYAVLIVDTITHMWDMAIASYDGRRTAGGTIPIGAWEAIKKPYRKFLSLCMNLPVHLFLIGREANDIRRDEDTGEMEVIGKKMRAEPETSYEPHVLIHMEHVKPSKTKPSVRLAHVEKDRTGILAGKVIADPTFDTLIGPILKSLGTEQAVVPSIEDAAAEEKVMVTEQAQAVAEESNSIMASFELEFKMAPTLDKLMEAASQLTPQVKSKLLPDDLRHLQSVFRESKKQLQRVHA